MRHDLKSGAVGLFICVAAAGLTACSDVDAGEPSFDEAAEIAAIDAVREQFMAAMGNADFAALAEIAGPNAIMIPPGGQAHLEMYAAAGQGFAPGFEIEIRPTEVVIINEEWAFGRGTSIQSWQPEGAEARTEIPNSYLIVLRKTNGQWRPYREVASAMPPPDGWP